MGAYNAAESGEDIRQCTALEINRVRQRLAVQIWRDYQEHITARIRYADPDADARTRLAEEMEQEEEEAEQALVRLYNEAYLQRMGRPQPIPHIQRISNRFPDRRKPPKWPISASWSP